MKYLKMMGLAAIAALGLLAFVGAGTASATTLFTDEAKTIAYPKGTTLHATLAPGSTATLTSGENTIATCTGSTVHGTTSSLSGERVPGTISSLTWEGCNQTTHTETTGSLEIEYISGSKPTSGTVFGKGSKVKLTIFGTTCAYGTGEGTHLGTLTGGTTPHLTITTTLPRVTGGFLCPSTGIWHATYVVTSPHALFPGA
jgi:hypothetical protein